MKIKSDDPVLTAYVLGELDEKTKVRISRALNTDSSLKEEEAQLSALSGLLEGTLGLERLSLGKDRIAEIHRAGQRPDPELLVLEHRKRTQRRALTAAAGVAALVVVGFILLSQSGNKSGSSLAGGDVAGEGAGMGLSGGTVIPGDSPDLPGVISPAKDGVAGLPMTVGQADPSMVERALAATGSLPPQDRFKVADWINLGRVGVPPASSQVVATDLEDLRVLWELGPCSWNPSAALLMIHLRPAGGKEVAVEAGLDLDPGQVKEVRLTGGAGEAGEAPVSSDSIASPRTFLYELDLIDDPGEFGSLQVKVREGKWQEIPLTGPIEDEKKVSLAFATARILGDFARWGASEGRDRETLVRLSREAKELLVQVNDESTRYALDMILITEETLGAQ